MRNLAIALAVWGSLLPLQAQKNIEKHMDFSGKQAVELNIQISDSITIHSWNKNEVYVSASINVNDNKDNDAYVTRFDDSGNSVKVDARFSDSYFKGKKNCCNTSMIYWTVYVPESAEVTVESINADLTIVGTMKKIKAKSISGFIDMTVQAAAKADLRMKTVSGTIYSNVDFPPSGKNGAVPSEVQAKLNDGGELYSLETISGDIFLREQK